MDRDRIVLLIGAAAVAVGAGAVIGQMAADERLGPPGSAHRHAYLFFDINGSEKALGSQYLEQAERVHLHGNDSILHVHADNVDLGYALRTLNISLTQRCLRFGPEGTDRCASGGLQPGVTINGESVGIQAALDHEIEQGDSIVVWFGPGPPGGYDRELPEAYQESVPGRSV